MVSVRDVILSEKRSREDHPFVPLKELLAQESFAAVDNSLSTAGATLRVAKAFVEALGVQKISLWNSICNPPAPLEKVRWYSRGGTEPSTIFEPTSKIPIDASCFLLLTDGCIWDTARLSLYASFTAHLPTILIIFGSEENEDKLVSEYNVSVLMAQFAAAETAAVLIINSESNCNVRLIAAKGDWSNHLEMPPILDDTTVMMDCPLVSIDQLQSLPSRVYPRIPRRGLAIGDGRILDLDALLQLQDGRELLDLLSEEELENISRAYLPRNRLEQWRAVLNRWLVVANKEASSRVLKMTRQSHSSVHDLLQRLQSASDAGERAAIQIELREAVAHSAAQVEKAEAQASQAVRSTRALLNNALMGVAALEESGMKATSLGRLSKRALRARTVDRNNLTKLSSLDVAGAPHEEDLVLYEKGPVTLCLRVMKDTSSNTSNEALNLSLQVGHYDVNAVFEPTIVSIQMADRIEEMDTSPLTRQRSSVCLPIVSLNNWKNRCAVFDRLCLVFMNELIMPHVWLIALSSILRTLETESWAEPETTPTGRLLNWFAAQIMEYVTLGEGFRLSPTTRLPIRDAFLQVYQTEIVTIHSSVMEVSVILRLLHRFVERDIVTKEQLMRVMLARIATAVPQVHRCWLLYNHSSPWKDDRPGSLTSLLTSIYDTKITNKGRHVPVPGSGRLVTDLSCILPLGSCEAVDAFARSLGVSITNLVVPGLSLVVAATLDAIKKPHISNKVAVQVVRASDPVVAAEMEPTTVGGITKEYALKIICARPC